MEEGRNLNTNEIALENTTKHQILAKLDWQEWNMIEN